MKPIILSSPVLVLTPSEATNVVELMDELENRHFLFVMLSMWAEGDAVIAANVCGHWDAIEVIPDFWERFQLKAATLTSQLPGVQDLQRFVMLIDRRKDEECRGGENVTHVVLNG